MINCAPKPRLVLSPAPTGGWSWATRTPACKAAKYVHDRPFQGRSSIDVVLATPPRVELARLTVIPSAVTWTFSATLPTCRVRFKTDSSPTVRIILLRTCVENPEAEAVSSYSPACRFGTV